MTLSKRQRILEGMLESVGEIGYEATSVRTVLDRTDLYRQAFYDDFEDKDACYLEAFDMGVETIAKKVRKAVDPEENWRTQLRTGLGTLLDLFEAEPDLARALVVEVHVAGPDALAKRAEVMERLAGFVDEAKFQAGKSGAPPQIASEGIVAGIHAIVHARLSAHEEAGLRGLLPEFMYFAVLPYFGPEAASAEMQAAKTA